MSSASSISGIRKDYRLRELTESAVEASPIDQFRKWWSEVLSAGIDEPNAMALSTASADGLPSARIVLLKGFHEGGFQFFTNYESYKARQLEENPRACLVFFWKELERQVRITGLVERVDPAESDVYFQSRPRESQIGAVVSPQSRVIESREWLHARWEAYRQQAGEAAILRPPHWGGYILKPVTVEFWQGRPGRLHDRIQYTLTEDGGWRIERLAP